MLIRPVLEWFGRSIWVEEGFRSAVKILLADDHVLFREGLKLILKKFDQSVDLIEADSFDEALKVAEASSALDLVLLDLKMPGIEGMEGLAAMRARTGDTPVVIISGAYAQSDIKRAFDHGAAGFIPKTMQSRAMMSAIDLVLSGERFVPSLAFVDQEGLEAAKAPQSAPENPFSSLTAREHDVLKLLVQGLSNRQIAQELRLKEVSIRARLTNVFRKLGVKNRMQAASLAIRRGYPD